MRTFLGLFLVGFALSAFGADVKIEILDSTGKVNGTTIVPVPVTDPPSDRILVQVLEDGVVKSATLIPIPIVVPPPPEEPPEEPPEDLPAEPGLLPEWLETMHDRMRLQGREYTDSVAKSGAWDDPGTWRDGTVPTPVDRVFIQPGANVNNDGNAVADTIVVEGVLTATTTKNTSFLVTTLTVLKAGQVFIGDDDAQVTAKCEIVIRDRPIDLAADPGSYGNGILVFGTFSTCGQKKTPFTRLTAEPLAGDDKLSCGRAMTNWAVGDSVVIPDTRQLAASERGLKFIPQWERHTIAKCDCPPGEEMEDVVELTKPLAFAHLGARDYTGKLDTLPHVANLTRSVVIRSENPAGVRGHVQFHARAQVSIKYTTFKDLGRTTMAKLGPANQIGRYQGPHFHHVIGAMPTASSAGPQYVMEGCVVDGGDANHDKKWGIVIHGTHFGHVVGNVIYNTGGAAIIIEDGSETENVVEDNLIIRVTGYSGRVDTSHGTATQGTGIYMKGPFSKVRRNVVANHVNSYAYTINLTYQGMRIIPTGPGKDPHMEGEGVEVDGNASGLAEFADNECYSGMSGMTFWWTGTYGVRPIAAAKETVIKNFFTWNHWEYGCYQYQNYRTTIDGFKTRGVVTNTNPGALAFFGSDYTAIDMKLVNADIQGQRTGWSVSVNGGPQTIENSRIYASAGINFGVPWTNGYRADGILERKVTIKNCVFGPPTPDAPFTTIARSWPVPLTGKTYNLIVLDTVNVVDYQGVAGDSFKVYALQQDPAFIVPETIINTIYGGPKVLGAPVAGKTNAELWESHKIAVAGEVAHCDTKRPEIIGYACPN